MQGGSWLHRDFEANLRYMRLYLEGEKKKSKQNKGINIQLTVENINGTYEKILTYI